MHFKTTNALMHVHIHTKSITPNFSTYILHENAINNTTDRPMCVYPPDYCTVIMLRSSSTVGLTALCSF